MKLFIMKFTPVLYYLSPLSDFNIIPIILFSNNLNPCSYLELRYQVSRPHKMGTIVF
jgi:hypothetical protein